MSIQLLSVLYTPAPATSSERICPDLCIFFRVSLLPLDVAETESQTGYAAPGGVLHFLLRRVPFPVFTKAFFFSRRVRVFSEQLPQLLSRRRLAFILTLSFSKPIHEHHVRNPFPWCGRLVIRRAPPRGRKFCKKEICGIQKSYFFRCSRTGGAGCLTDLNLIVLIYKMNISDFFKNLRVLTSIDAVEVLAVRILPCLSVKEGFILASCDDRNEK